MTTAMARVRSGTPTHQSTGSSPDALARLLETPHLASVVPRLAPEMLHQVIRHYGLDSCGALVASATPAQLASVFDLDLWRDGGPGRDERFDVERFGEWLDVLVDMDVDIAARIVAAMDESVVVAGLSRFVRVFDPATFAPTSSDGPADESEATPIDALEADVGGYRVRALHTGSWDAIIAVLLALDADHRDHFHDIMQGCRRLSNSTPESDGLDDLLSPSEQLMYDVALDRDRRRSQQGYGAAAEARAFLQLARQRRGTSGGGARSFNPIAAAYLRDADAAVAPSEDDAGGPSARADGEVDGRGAADHRGHDRSVSTLAGPVRVPERPRTLIEGGNRQSSRHTHVRTLMAYLRDHDDDVYWRRSRELAFLANMLVSGCRVQSRSFTPQEALDAAAGICNLALERWPAGESGSLECGAPVAGGDRVRLPATFLRDHDLVTAFESGWAMLHEDVCLFVADRLIAVLGDLRCADPSIQDDLHTLRRALVSQRDTGTPWRARDALDVIAMLDMPAWTGLLGLLAECPVMAAALPATLEGRTGAISATAFECISTSSQIAAVQEFMARLPHLLRR